MLTQKQCHEQLLECARIIDENCVLYRRTTQVKILLHFIQRSLADPMSNNIVKMIQDAVREGTVREPMRREWATDTIRNRSDLRGRRGAGSRKRSGGNSAGQSSKRHRDDEGRRSETRWMDRMRDPQNANFNSYPWCVYYWDPDSNCTETQCRFQHDPKWTSDQACEARRAARGGRRSGGHR